MNILKIYVEEEGDTNHQEFMQYVITQVLYDVTRSYTKYHKKVISDENFIMDENIDCNTRGIFYYLLATKAFNSCHYVKCVNYANNAIANNCYDAYSILGQYYYQIENNKAYGQELFLLGHSQNNISCTLLYLETLYCEGKTVLECCNYLCCNQKFEKYIFMIIHKVYFEGINGLLLLNEEEYRYEVILSIAKYYMYIERNGHDAIKYLRPLYNDSRYNMKSLEKFDNSEWEHFYQRIHHIFYNENNNKVSTLQNNTYDNTIIQTFKKYFSV